MAWTKLTTVDEVPPGSVIEAEHGGELYAICNVDGEIRAVSGVCPHHGGPLGQGALYGKLLTCPWHMWEFDSATGACALNADFNIPVFPVRVENDQVLVEIPDA